jgi:Domain of unknown function (DUF4124)
MTQVVKRLLGLLVAIVAGAAFAADTYKWVDEKGVTTYGEKPPAGRAAKPVDTTPVGPTGTVDGSPPDRSDAVKRRQAEELRPQPTTASVPPPVPAAPQARGMEFETFIRLQRGMTEGELLVRAGQPDHESVENFRNAIVKTYYYFPTAANPFTTVVTVRGGRIANLDRVKKF